MNQSIQSILFKRKQQSRFDTASEILNAYTHIRPFKSVSASLSSPQENEDLKSELGGIVVYENNNSPAVSPLESYSYKREVSPEEFYELQKASPSDCNSYFQRKPFDPYPKGSPMTYDLKDTLVFSSHFESGNLKKAIKMNDYEYHLILQNDTGTNGNNHWYYFSVSNLHNSRVMPITFKIINLVKANQLYVEGLSPAVYSVKRQEIEGLEWHRDTHGVLYENSSCNLHTLTFNYNFKHLDDTVYFAYSIPYTYADLLEYTRYISQEFSHIARVNTLCKSLGGNECPLVTITNKIDNLISFEEEVHQWGISAAGRKLLKHRQQKLDRLEKSKKRHRHKKGIVITGRVHSGESVSSFMVKGFIDYLLGDSREAKLLRNHFVFKVVPMLNPDGVRYGNYRTNLIGVDLNRRWLNPNKILHPTVFYAKKMLEVFNENHEVVLYTDFHGHSRKKNVFMYGCRVKSNDHIDMRKNLLAKVVPVLMFHKNPFFSFNSCKFRMERSKEGTARIVVFKQFKIASSYTIEATAYGPSSSKALSLTTDNHMTTLHYQSLGTDLSKVCLNFMSPSIYSKKTIFVNNFLRNRIFKPLVEDFSPQEGDSKGKKTFKNSKSKFRDFCYKEDFWKEIEIVEEEEEEDTESEGSDSGISNGEDLRHTLDQKDLAQSLGMKDLRQKIFAKDLRHPMETEDPRSSKKPNEINAIRIIKGKGIKETKSTTPSAMRKLSQTTKEQRLLKTQRSSGIPIKPHFYFPKSDTPDLSKYSLKESSVQRKDMSLVSYPKSSTYSKPTQSIVSRIKLSSIERKPSINGRAETLSPYKQELTLSDIYTKDKEASSPKIPQIKKRSVKPLRNDYCLDLKQLKPINLKIDLSKIYR